MRTSNTPQTCYHTCGIAAIRRQGANGLSALTVAWTPVRDLLLSPQRLLQERVFSLDLSCGQCPRLTVVYPADGKD